MSKGSLFWGKGSGKLGETVMYRANGQQITRTYVANPNNPQTNSQMRQRSAFGIIGSANRAVQPKFYPLDKQRTTDYAKFLRANLSADKVKFWNTREEVVFAKANGVAPLEYYQLASGNLPKPTALTAQFSSSTGGYAASASISVPKSFYNRYLDEFGAEETEHDIEVMRVINDILTAYNYSTLYHPVIAFGLVTKRACIPAEFTQADFFALRAVDFIEIVPENLASDEKITLTANSDKTAITAITSSENIPTGDKFGSYVSIYNGGSASDTYFRIGMPNLTISLDEGETVHGTWCDTANVKRIGGYDASNLQVTEQSMSVSLPYSFTYPRMRGNGTTPVDLQFIENWKRTIAEGDDAVLKRIGILG